MMAGRRRLARTPATCYSPPLAFTSSFACETVILSSRPTLQRVATAPVSCGLKLERVSLRRMVRGAGRWSVLGGAGLVCALALVASAAAQQSSKTTAQGVFTEAQALRGQK